MTSGVWLQAGFFILICAGMFSAVLHVAREKAVRRSHENGTIILAMVFFSVSLILAWELGILPIMERLA